MGLIQFSVKRDNPAEAADIANSICKHFADRNDGAAVAKMAQPNHRPVSPNLFRSVLAGLFQGAILMGIGLTFLFAGIRKQKSKPAPAYAENPH
ncbi:hypothetical protein EGM51_16180 [Verrucomicrobia bacterium S94]|nr:hypothetical protein EGM51_16180 [Verrucomicrobia bacterium S94]